MHINFRRVGKADSKDNNEDGSGVTTEGSEDK